MHIICFEDSLVDRLSPIVHARPAYGVTCASLRLIDWLKQFAAQGHTLTAVCRDYLQAIQRLDFGLDGPAELNDNDTLLLVNARLVPTVGLVNELRVIAERPGSAVVLDDEDRCVLVAKLEPADWQKIKSRPPTLPLIDALLATAATQKNTHAKLAAFHWPHDVVWQHMQLMPAAMQWRIQAGDYQQLRDGVFVKPGVKIGNYESIHTSAGPIVLENDVTIGPFCFLEGPLHAGAGTRVLEHAAIKDGVSLGHTVKIGGEVEASIIEPYTNKQHHGFLGHSYLGSWINLGAGTCNSDLKNTYGKINIEYGDHKIATGMQFLGCIMGDYSKSAINTGIFTGKVIGVCSMMYGFVTSNVPSYVNYARLFGQTSLLPADVMINTQERMFARRKVQQRECDKQLIIDMYDRTADERDEAHMGL